MNIPTEELRDFMPDDEKRQKTTLYERPLLYPRDPSKDPQLVWRGKDEQDAHPLEVPEVPIYIQEKIHPQAIIENLRETAKSGEPEPELALFTDFNGIKFEDQIEFYQHEQNWQNRMILGDSLLVMNSLAEKEGLKGKVQMIYLDPPYGIKFGSNWQVSTNKRDVKDSNAADATRQPEQIRAFRDTWKLGIHSYLDYLRDRLVVARDLLTVTGSVFVQIGDENVHLVRSVIDEVFGNENFCSLICVTKTSGATTELLAGVADYILWYAKVKESVKYRDLFEVKELSQATSYGRVELADGTRRTLTSDENNDISKLPKGARPFTLGDLTSQRPPGSFPVFFKGATYTPRTNFWKTGEAGFPKLIIAGRVEAVGSVLRYVRYFGDFPATARNNVWTEFGGATDKVYVVQTSTRVIERCMLMTTDPGDLVLDPTCGSGTTAYVAEQWGRRWITIDTSRVALALARTRIMAAKYPYYLLRDTADGRKKEMELTLGASAGTAPQQSGRVSAPDVRQGFVYKRVPHVTLKSIANNEEIDVIYERYQSQMEPLRAEFNKLTKQQFEEWQIPREADAKWSDKAREIHAKWWKLKRERQREIDDSIARRADIEYLFDQPYEDKSRIRVAGPFTVESLSPHRVLSMEESPIGGAPVVAQMPPPQASDFVSIILDNLRKAPIQTTKKIERLKFDRIEPAPGPWINAKGFYTDKDGKERMAAIAVGPEHGTVSPELIEQAGVEAVRARPKYDALYVLGFSFDPYVDTEKSKFGSLPIVMTKMNPDLAMGDELLKKTGAGNLFMVFGEPDIDPKKSKDGKWIVTLNGVDVYDPTTGEVRSDSTNDIACWFIDTNYDGKSFFVRHAYFLGDKEPYDKLKRALKAEIDEAAWESLYSNVSRPFDTPRTGQIAVKVINNYGDEVLKVYQCK